jgi:N-acetylneuraminate synthase/N,N'-diacetyllegionaminate synthase
MNIKIGEKIIGKKYPCFVIAEAGLNHNGKFSLAKELIKDAKKAGAQAVKFQTLKPNKIVGSNHPAFDFFKKITFTNKQWKLLVQIAKNVGIIFLSTPFDEDSADALANIGVPAFKISSGDITNLPLLIHVAKKKKPIILSTGASTINEIKSAVKAIYTAKNKKLILLHCVSLYPTPIDKAQLLTIKLLQKIFKIPIGFSDHTLGTEVPPLAVALGARVIEKHFTLNKRLSGPDHKLSLSPSELKQMIARIRDAETALGTGLKKISSQEKKVKKIVGRSVCAKNNIPAKTKITRKMLVCLRPAGGIPPKDIKKVIGKKGKKNIKQYEQLSWSKLS